MSDEPTNTEPTHDEFTPDPGDIEYPFDSPNYVAPSGTGAGGSH